MAVKISRPYLHNGLKASGYDVEKATPKAMQSLSCGQCHVEYYFDDNTREVIFPGLPCTHVESPASWMRNVEERCSWEK